MELAGFFCVLLKQGRNELDDPVALRAGEPPYFLEDALELAGSSGAGDERWRQPRGLWSEDVVGGNAEGASEGWEGVRAGWVGAALPEGDVALGDTHEPSELCLGESCGAPEGCEVGALRRTIAFELSAHAWCGGL